VVGDQEKNTGTITLRERDKKDVLGKFSINEVLHLFGQQKPPKSEAEKEMESLSFFDNANQELDALD